MPLDRAFPIWTATLRRPGGPDVTVTLTLPSPFGVASDADDVADRLSGAIRRYWLRQGEYDALLAARLAAPVPGTLDVDLPEKDALHPALSLRFVTVAAEAEGTLVWAPAADVVAWGRDRAAADAAARDAVLAWIARKDLRDDPVALLGAAAYTAVSVQPVDVLLSFFSLAERRDLDRRDDEASQAPLRTRATAPVKADRAFELDDVRKILRRAVRARAGAGVVLVGPRGSGKTCLLADEVHSRDSAFEGEVRTTTAARLEHVLTDGKPWQAALASLCADLHRDGVWLHVASLADLFEVGRYVGNPTSLGEYLRPWLARGDLRLVAECTPEEYATIEARYPGVVDHLARVDVPAPDAGRLLRTVTAWCRHRKIRIDAGEEAIRLQRRFLPYAGFPGITLRFLAGIAKDAAPTPEAVTARFCEESGFPRAFLDPAVPMDAAALHARLAGALYGQPDAVDTLADVVLSVKADVASRDRPIASLLFLGPTGVGKTEAARALATILFGDRDRMVRFDCSEIATPYAVQRLVASPDGHGEGRLTGAVRRQPFSVVLLDEIEKAHPDFFDLLLQVLGEGRLTDHRGRTADFCSAIVVMTSNLGADRTQRQRVGVGRSADDLGGELKTAVYQAFRPELVNRFDRIVPFAPLGRDAVARVLDREIQALSLHPVLASRGAVVAVSEAAKRILLDRGHDPTRGARPLQRALRDGVLAPMAAALDAEPAVIAPKLEVDGHGGRVTVRIAARGAPTEQPREPIAWERRAIGRVLAGDTAADLATTARLAARRARMAEEAFDVAVAAPLDELRAVRADLRALEGRWLAAVLAREPTPPEAELAPLKTRKRAAERALIHAVHPHRATAFLGVWTPSPSKEPNAAAQAWIEQVAANAEGHGFEAHLRDVVIVGNAAVATETIPRHATRWVGRELWIVGPGAWWFLPIARARWDQAEIYQSGQTRFRVGRATVAGRSPPCCAANPPALQERRDPPARAAVPERWDPPRPSELLRRSTYDGTPIEWPPQTPTADTFASAVYVHLAERQ